MCNQREIAALRRGTWQDFRLHPTKLTRLVVEGKATIVGKDEFGRHIYEIERKHLGGN